MRFDFTVKVGETAYNCHRIVSGEDAFTQTIHVIGFGSQSDGTSYGDGGRAVDTMEVAAKMIAGELIRQVRSTDD